MATAIATKPAPPHQKMKRPPPPAVQTSMNGARSSQSSPSPSVGSIRPPSGSKHPPATTNINGGSGGLNSAGPRSSTRRRDVRTGKPGQGDGSIGGRNQRRMTEPYAKTTSYILKKYKKAHPSLIIHLHPTHFRFDQQDGTFSYSSPMCFLLKHFKEETVPHDIIEELLTGGVRFYEGCLIVQVHDHRSASSKPSNSKAASADDKHVPFSIHNHNEHLTPSPYAPWPETTNPDADSHESKPDEALTNAATNANGNDSTKRSELDSVSTQKEVRIFTVVLFPTPQSMQAELEFYATTPDPRNGNRKQSTAGVPRTPASATMPHPPTPLSAVPTTPSINGPPNKKQKMLVGANDIRNFESRAIDATAAPLFLEPVNNLQEVQKLLQSLSDPRHEHEYPAPKTRKRTVAELAADEAAAAAQERFLLSMDERRTSGGRANTADAGGGAASFEPQFESFKVLYQIRQVHKQREREAFEQRAAAQAAAKARSDMQQEHERLAREQHQAQQEHQAHQMQQEHAKEDMRLESNKNKSNANMAAMVKHQHQQRQQAAAAQQAALQAQQATSNNIITNGQTQHVLSGPQSHHSSPVVRSNTPHSASSPLIGHVSQGGGVPMKMSTSGQGIASSPARPPSAMQHGHPQGGIQMLHQRSQQGPSRRGTPQMQHGTPSMPHATPAMHSATPTSRMNHGSPPNIMAHTPVLNPNTIAAQHIQATQQIPPEQQQRILHQRQQQQQKVEEQRRQAAHIQAQMQNSSPQPNQMSPAHQMQYQNFQNRQYQDQLRRTQQQQMAQLTSPHPGQAHPHGHPGQPPQAGQPGMARMPPQQPGQPMNPGQQLNAYLQRIQSQAYTTRLKQIQNQFGGQIPPEKLEAAQQSAMQTAKTEALKNKDNWVRQQQERARNLAMQREIGMGGMTAAQMNAMGINMNGMNGMPQGGMPMGGGMNGMGAQMGGMGTMGGLNINGMGGMNGMGGGGMQ